MLEFLIDVPGTVWFLVVVAAVALVAVVLADKYVGFMMGDD